MSKHSEQLDNWFQNWPLAKLALRRTRPPYSKVTQEIIDALVAMVDADATGPFAGVEA